LRGWWCVLNHLFSFVVPSQNDSLFTAQWWDCIYCIREYHQDDWW
jgi:hypothetical protein